MLFRFATVSGVVGSFSGTLTFTIGPAIVIQAPVASAPSAGSTTSTAKPTFTVTNAVRSGPAGTLTYLFEVASNSSFATIVASGTVGEGTGTTSFTPSSNLSASTTYFWHAKATDVTNNISTAFSTTTSFATPAPNPASELWPGVQPTGTPGKAIRGEGWEPGTRVSFAGVTYQSPPLEVSRLFDLIDRGYGVQEGIDWMKANGYPTVAVYYPQVLAIGYEWVYLALVGNQWNLVHRVGA